MPAIFGKMGRPCRYGWLDLVFSHSTDGHDVKETMKRWVQQILVLLAWLGDTLLGLWVVIAVQQTVFTALAVWYVQDSNVRAWRARFYDRAYYVVAGLGYLIFIFILDGYLRDGLEKGDTFRRFAKVTGIGLLILFPVDLLNLLIHGWAQGARLGGYSLLLLVLELLGGAALVAYAWHHHPKRKLARLETI
jgi:hypothetical protein